MKKLILILVILLMLIPTNVQADSMHVKALDTVKRDNMTIDEPVWNAKVKEPNCNLNPAFPAPRFEQYLDGDTDPITAWFDYLEDFRWWIAENNLCPNVFVEER
jgi:hypothetical protein